MNQTALIQQLAYFIYDNQNEEQDYFKFCDENSRVPENYAANTDHIYAVASLILEQLQKEETREVLSTSCKERCILLRLVANFPGRVDDHQNVRGSDLVEWISNEIYALMPDDQIVERTKFGSPDSEV